MLVRLQLSRRHVIGEISISGSRQFLGPVSVCPKPQGLAACEPREPYGILPPIMGTKSRDRLYGTSVRIAAQRAAEARREADKLACEAWTKHMLA